MGAIAGFFANTVPTHMYFCVQILIAELMFVAGRKKRSHFYARLAFGIALYLLVGYFHPTMGDKFVRVLFIFVESILLLWFLCDERFTCVLFMSVAAYAVQNLAYNVGELIVGLSGLVRKSFYFYLFTALAFFGVYAGCYFVVVKRFDRKKEFYIGNVPCFLLAVVTVAVTLTKNLIASHNWLSTELLLALFCAVSCMLTLAVQFAALRQSETDEQNRVIEQILNSERRRLKSMEESINIINMKCHDIRFHMKKLQEGGGDDTFFCEMNDALSIYDSIAKTGNSALDVVLSEKLLFCNANKISVSYLVDTDVIASMSVSDIYSLFGNALDNAINSVMTETDDKRIISISAKKQGSFGQILVSNYCSTPPEFENGLPVTKGDPTVHGYGVKSIKYIVDKYNGNLTIECADNMFCLAILLP